MADFLGLNVFKATDNVSYDKLVENFRIIDNFAEENHATDSYSPTSPLAMSGVAVSDAITHGVSQISYSSGSHEITNVQEALDYLLQYGGGGGSIAPTNSEQVKHSLQFLGTSENVKQAFDAVENYVMGQDYKFQALEQSANNHDNEITAINEAIVGLQNQINNLPTLEEIVDAVIETLGYPVFGTVDENNVITLSGKLPDGTYTAKYETEEGTIDIGEFVLGEAEPTYTNLADPTSSDWADGKRYNSSGALVGVDAGVVGAVTNFIGGDLKVGDVIRVKGMDLRTYRTAIYDKTKTSQVALFPMGNTTSTATYFENVSVDETGATFTVKASSDGVLTDGGYLRFCGTLTGTSADVIITKNEPIN